MKAAAVFASVPFWAVGLAYIVIFIGAVVWANLNDNKFVQIAAYAIAVLPFGLFIELFVMMKLTFWEKGGDWVYRAGIICTIAIAVFTVMAAAMPRMMLRPKTAGIMGVVAYVVSLFIAVGIVNSGVLGLWSILFSAAVMAPVVYNWSSEAVGAVDLQHACSTPSRTFLSIVDKVQTINDG